MSSPSKFTSFLGAGIYVSPVQLYQKGLYKQSLKILDKAKSFALKYDENASAYEIVEFEKLIESLYVTRSLSNRTNELVSQTNHLREQNEV